MKDGNNDVMAAALAAVEGDITLAPSRDERIRKVLSSIPEGACLVACKLERLERDKDLSGKYIVPVTTGWRPHGMAIALSRDGHVMFANHVFGRISYSVPKVIGCHVSTCEKCGHREITPVATWEAKREAAKAGENVSELDNVSSRYILRNFGKCPKCGGKWSDSEDYERETLNAFLDEVLASLEAEKEGGIGRFLPPKAFTMRPVEEAVNIGDEWEWLVSALTRKFIAPLPASEKLTGGLIVYNPGYWYGWWKGAPDDTELFFRERGEGPKHDRHGSGRIDFSKLSGL